MIDRDNLTPAQSTLVQMLDLLKTVAARAVPYFEDDEGIDQLLIMVVDNDNYYSSVVTPVRIMFKGGDHIDELRPDILRAIMRALDCKYYALCTEAWISTADNEDQIEERLKAPNSEKTSALVITGETFEGDYGAFCYVIRVDPEGKRYVAELDNDVLFSAQQRPEKKFKSGMIGLLDPNIPILDHPLIRIITKEARKLFDVSTNPIRKGK